MQRLDTLESIAYLLESSTSTTTLAHLVSLLHQRTAALLQLQSALRHFSSRREGLTLLQSAYSEEVERVIHDEEALEGPKSTATRQTLRDAESRFLGAWDDVLARFEKQWSEQISVLESWELDPSLVVVEPPHASTSSASELSFSVPNSWMYSLPDPANSTPTILRFLSLLLSQPYVLGAGIATLEGASLTNLLPPLPTTSTLSALHSTPSPIKTLLQIMAHKGAKEVLELAMGIWDTAVREIVGREKSDRLEEGSPVAGGGSQRVKELEAFLVGLLDVIDSLGLEVNRNPTNPPPPSSTDSSHLGPAGPLSLHRGIEEILLHLLTSAPLLRATSSKIAPQSATPLPNPTSWGSAVTSTFSTLLNTSTSGLYSVASLSGAGLTTVANAASLGFLPLATVTPPDSAPRTPSPSQFRPRSASTSISSPSTFLPPTTSLNPLSVLLTRSATSLLKLLTPSPSSSPKPLLESLFHRLLSHSFPASTSSSSNRKVLLLGLIRWWSFSYLSRKLGQAGSGAGWTTMKVPYGATFDGDAESGSEGRREATLLEEVYVNGRDKVELLLGLHRVIYGAVVEACGLGKGSESMGGGGDRDTRALNRAARALVAAWSLETPKVAKTASPAKEKEVGREIRALLIGPDDFSTLVISFGQLVLRSHVPFFSPPRHNPQGGRPAQVHVSPTFKRSPAFIGTSSSIPTIRNRAGEETGGGDLGGEEGADEMLSDKLDIVLADIFSVVSKLPALLFVIPGSLEFTTRIPDQYLLPPPKSTSTSTSTSQPPLPIAPQPTTPSSTTNQPNPNKDRNKGWNSPPGSPRQEALQSSLQDQSSHFSQRKQPTTLGIDIIPEGDIPPIVSSSPTSNLIWRPIATRTTSVQPQKLTTPVLSSREVALLRKGVFSLIRSGYITRRSKPSSDVFQSSGLSTNSSNSHHPLIESLTTASRRSAEERQYTSHVLYNQCLSIFRHHGSTSATIDFILARVAAPLREAQEKSSAILLLTQTRLDEIEGQRRRLLDLARSLRGEFDDAIRIRAWYSSVKASNLGRQFRARVKEAVAPNRSQREKERALNKVENWQQELGIYSFARATDSIFEEALMLVESCVNLAIQPKSFYANPFWSREKSVVDSLVAQRVGNTDTEYRPSFAETLLGAGSSILTAPFSLAGLPFPSTSSNSALNSIGGVPLPTNVILSFGATAPSMLKPIEKNTSFAGAVEEHLLRIGLKLSGYLWSDITSTYVLNRDDDGRLVGCDSWFEEFASPLSPLVRPSPSEIPLGVAPLPKAFVPSTTPPPPYYKKLVERFILHPSPNAKIHALLELELVLTASLSAPSSAQNFATVGSEKKEEQAELRPTHTRARSYLAKLSGLLSKRLSLAPSPIAKLLEGDDEDDEKDDENAHESGDTTKDGDPVPILEDGETSFDEHASHSSSSNRPQSPTSPRRRARQVSILSSSTTTFPENDLDLPPQSHHPLLSLALEPPPSSVPSSESDGTSPSTDTLLVALESILKHVRPSTLFQSLQIVASLTPSAVLDSDFKGKAFWDVGLAALSVKRDVIEGEFGVVERALAALGEGTDEGGGLARRLLEIAAKEEAQVAMELIKSMKSESGQGIVN